MRIQLFSDLHLERNVDFRPQFAADVDVVVLAGDIGSYQSGSRLDGDDFGLERFSPLRPGASFSRVLYVPGNHEFDSLDYEATYARLRATCERLGITWLEREVAVVGGVRFIGTTLWTDFEALVGSPLQPDKQMALRDKAFRAANFYLNKNTTLRQGEPVLAEGIRALALECQHWLRAALAVPFDGLTVAVTHFAPTLHSADPRYGLTPGTAGFCNALDELLPLADVWMHGHLHCANDYTVKGQRDGRPWSCRVVANPLGYVSKGEQASFHEKMIITI